MEIKYIKWRDLKPSIKNQLFITINADGSRLYYQPLHSEDKLGFSFKQINLVSYTYGQEWVDEDADCEILMHGTAYFDGVRHLHFGSEHSDNLGYFYYPSIKGIKAALDVLRSLEIQYCSDID